VGDAAYALSILESGRVELVIGREDRSSLAGFLLRKGEVFGPAAPPEYLPRQIAQKALKVLAGHPRPAS
jgi:toluene monooxygenase system ferredoxin subunit